MKRLIVCGALLFSGFSGLVTGCGSRSSDDLYLPEVTAGEAPFSRSGNGGADVGTAGRDFSAGDSGLAGDSSGSSGAPSGGGFSSAGAAGSVAASGSSGFLSFGGSIGIAGASGFTQGGAAAGGASGAAVGGASGAAVGGASGGFADAGAPSEGGSAGFSVAGSGGASIAGSGGLNAGGAAGTADAGSSGFSGSSGAGTAGGNSLSCPVAAPQNNNMCSDTSLSCSYVGERCRCRQAGPNTVWRCTGSGDACPSTHPVAASSCTGNLQCPYPAGDQCNCLNGKWNCFSPGCPASKPAPGGSCGAVAGQCTYGTAGACVCVGGGWFCN